MPRQNYLNKSLSKYYPVYKKILKKLINNNVHIFLLVMATFYFKSVMKPFDEFYIKNSKYYSQIKFSTTKLRETRRVIENVFKKMSL